MSPAVIGQDHLLVHRWARGRCRGASGRQPRGGERDQDLQWHLCHHIYLDAIRGGTVASFYLGFSGAVGMFGIGSDVCTMVT
jgi:hypothetical protein